MFFRHFQYLVLFFAELSKSATVVAVNTVEVGSHKYNCSDKEVNLVTIVKMYWKLPTSSVNSNITNEVGSFYKQHY